MARIWKAAMVAVVLFAMVRERALHAEPGDDYKDIAELKNAGGSVSIIVVRRRAGDRTARVYLRSPSLGYGISFGPEHCKAVAAMVSARRGKVQGSGANFLQVEPLRDGLRLTVLQHAGGTYPPVVYDVGEDELPTLREALEQVAKELVHPMALLRDGNATLEVVLEVRSAPGSSGFVRIDRSGSSALARLYRPEDWRALRTAVSSGHGQVGNGMIVQIESVGDRLQLKLQDSFYLQNPERSRTEHPPVTFQLDAINRVVLMSALDLLTAQLPPAN